MDFTRARKTFAAAVLAFVLSAGPAPAEVKLRIYLQDGSLQSGTLVAENPKSFVILTQEGRQEIPKNSIMFINGKTLKQWQDRPDKLFQTEIIPSEIPNPAFVNDKSIPQAPALPAAPTVPPAAVVAVEKKAPVRKKQKAPPPEEKISPKEEPETRPSPVDAEVAEAKAQREAADRRAEAQKRAQEKKDAEAVLAVLAKEEKAKARAEAERAKEKAKAPPASVDMPPAGRGKFDRLAAGAAHHDRARAHRKNGEPGRAIQEYHYARLLEPYNPDIYLNLGMLYLDQGLRAEARNLFSHRSLRKSSEAKKLVARIDAELAAKKEADFRSRLTAGAAAFAWLPILIAMRLIRRRRKPATKQTTISADDLQPDAVETIAELASPIPMVAPEPLPVAEEEKTLVMEAPVAEPAPANLAGLPEYLANLTKAPPPPVPPVVEQAVEPPPISEPVPVSEEPLAPEPVPEPVAEEPAAPVPAPQDRVPEPEEILSMARSVEHSLIRGNQWAVDGKLDDARRAYRTALALNAACVSAHIGLAYIAFCEEKWEVALLHYRRAIDIDPMSADAHYGVARVLLEINRVDDAVPELRATLQIDPTYDDARDTLTALSRPA